MYTQTTHWRRPLTKSFFPPMFLSSHPCPYVMQSCDHHLKQRKVPSRNHRSLQNDIRHIANKKTHLTVQSKSLTPYLPTQDIASVSGDFVLCVFSHRRRCYSSDLKRKTRRKRKCLFFCLINASKKNYSKCSLNSHTQTPKSPYSGVSLCRRRKKGEEGWFPDGDSPTYTDMLLIQQ